MVLLTGLFPTTRLLQQELKALNGYFFRIE